MAENLTKLNTVSSAATNNEPTNKLSYLPIAMAVSSSTAIFALVYSWRAVRWRARVRAAHLLEDAPHVWEEGSMLDCSNEEFKSAVLQSAAARGTAALAKTANFECTSPRAATDNHIEFDTKSGSVESSVTAGSSNSVIDATSCHSPSSSGNDSSSDKESKDENCNQCARDEGKTRIARRITGQVGGLSPHKRPVLTLEPHANHVLKPLRLTKDTRGIREVAFYEALLFANALPWVMPTSPSHSSLQSSFRSLIMSLDSFMNHRAKNIHMSPVLSLLSLYRQRKSHASPSVSVNGGINNLPLSVPPYCYVYPCVRYDSSRHINANATSTPAKEATDNNNIKITDPYDLSFLAATHHREQDPIVFTSLQTYATAWYNLCSEIDSLRQLSRFTPEYHGVIDLCALEQDHAIKSETDNCQHDSKIPSSSKSPTESINCIASANPSPNLLKNPYLLLHNTTHPFHKPCTIDIKMGTQTYEPSATPQKQQRECRKYPYQKEFAFRIVGMRIYDPHCSHSNAEATNYQTLDKSFGLSLRRREEIEDAFRFFLRIDGDISNATKTHVLNTSGNNDNSKRRNTSRGFKLISSIIQQLSQIKSWFETNTTLSFYASSILIVYEGDILLNETEDADNHDDNFLDDPNNDQRNHGKQDTMHEPAVRMIDFAHVCRKNGGDDGYLKGLNVLLDIFSKIRDEIQ